MTVLILVAVSYAFVGYDTFDSLGDNRVRFLFSTAPIIVGLVSAVAGALWPTLLVRTLGRLLDAITEIVRFT